MRSKQGCLTEVQTRRLVLFCRVMSTALAAARAKTKGKRLLRDALEGYGEDAFTLAEWNAKKRDAATTGKWTWRQRVASTNAAVKERVERDRDAQDALQTRFVDIYTAMEQELGGRLSGGDDGALVPNDASAHQCSWRGRMGSTLYHCVNDLPVDKKSVNAATHARSEPTQPTKRFCRWHTRECTWTDHPMERSKVVEIPNECGLCLHCYDATATTQRGTLQKTPPRVPATKVPGVSATSLRRDVQRDSLLVTKRRGAKKAAEVAFTATSVCTWQKEHSEEAFVWRCSNRVLMHPTLSGAYLSFCGFHAPRCIKEYGRKGKRDQLCPPLDRRLNGFGLCRNHLEAHLSTHNFEERGGCVLVDSEFDVPGIKECKQEPVVAVITRHPLAPRHPPPQTTAVLDSAIQYVAPDVTSVPRDGLVKRILALAGAFVKRQVDVVTSVVLDSPNPVSRILKELAWRFQFLRRARVVAIRIQRIFRGNRARRRVQALQYEQAALTRIRACHVLQKYARGYVGRQRFRCEFEGVHRAVPTIQRVMRGGLARKRCRELRAALRLQRNYRCYRQRLLAWAVREEIEYMKALQRQADVNLQEMEEKLATFRRLRARRLLRKQMLRWKNQREARAIELALRLQTLWSAVKIQRQWRAHQYYETVKRRYYSAQCIQRRVRGWLTRHMWRGDPGILSVTNFVSVRSGWEYRKVVVLAQPSRSYSYPSRRVRMLVAAVTVQRLFRGYLGRLRANEQWLNMVRRWEWIGIEATDASGKSSDSMTVGKERYGFVVPSFGYHADERLHMKPIVRDVKASRGFAYEYQFILDLIKDRDGLRAWSLTHEQREHRRREQQLQHTKKPLSVASVASPTKLSLSERRSASKPDCISMPKALFPVGSTVRVAVFNTPKKGKAFHHAKVVRVHGGMERVGDSTTFDVEYAPVRSLYGLTIC